MLSRRSGAVVKEIRHIESKRVRLDSRRPAIRVAKLGKPTPGLASVPPSLLSIPTATPTIHLPDGWTLNKNTRGQKGGD